MIKDAPNSIRPPSEATLLVKEDATQTRIIIAIETTQIETHQTKLSTSRSKAAIREELLFPGIRFTQDDPESASFIAFLNAPSTGILGLSSGAHLQTSLISL